MEELELTDENIDRLADEAKQKKKRDKMLTRLAYEQNGMVFDKVEGLELENNPGDVKKLCQTVNDVV